MRALGGTLVAVALAVAAPATARAAPASREDCRRVLPKLKAWENDKTPVSDGDVAECVKQATAEQVRCLAAAATQEAGRACMEAGAATATAPTSAVADDPAERKPAPCRLTVTAPKPLPAALLHALRASTDDVLPHQAIVAKSEGEGGEGVRVFDPADLRRVVTLPGDVGEAMLLPARVVAVRDRQELVVAPAGGAPLVAVRKGHALRSIDALAAGPGGDTYVAGVEDRSMLFVDRIDRAGKLAAHHVVARGALLSVRLGRTSGGKLAVAWLEAAGPERATALWLAWCDRDGTPGKPMHVDAAAEQQAFANLAMAGNGEGVVVAWDPIVVGAGGKEDAKEMVPVEIRAFHADAGGAPPALVRRVATTSMSWVVAGSAGGVVPNALQALAFGRNAVLVWVAMAKESAELRGVAVDGGTATVLVAKMRAQPVARSDGKMATATATTATVMLEEPNEGHRVVTLRCE